ncbi:MAG: group I intron-associated PD-(D/E)XK endonuclease [Actinomycetota bacterium]
MRLTQRKGDIATAKGVHTFTALGLDVSLPLTESAPYDLVVDDGTGLFRVQCKFTSLEQVGLRRIHSNAQGYVVKFTSPAAYDWLYILHADGREYLLKECLAGRNSWKLRPEYLLGAVAESGLSQLP